MTPADRLALLSTRDAYALAEAEGWIPPRAEDEWFRALPAAQQHAIDAHERAVYAAAETLAADHRISLEREG